MENVKETVALDKAELMKVAETASVQDLGQMILALQEEFAKESTDFLQGKKVAGARSRKASLKIQGLFGLWRKRSIESVAKK